MYQTTNTRNLLILLTSSLLFIACGPTHEGGNNGVDTGGHSSTSHTNNQVKTIPGASCTKEGECQDGYVCVGTSGSYTCIKGCTFPKGEECNGTGKTCASTTGPRRNRDACTAVPGGKTIVKAGEDCGDSSKECGTGFECIEVSTGSYKCVKGCPSTAPDCEGEAFVCADATNKGGTNTKACIGDPKTKLAEYKKCTVKLANTLGQASSPYTVIATPNPNSPTISTQSNYTEVTFVSGLAQLAAQTTSAFYLDLNHTDASVKVDVSDKDAFTKSSDWQVAFRYYDFLVNGGAFPGDYEIASVTGSETDFSSYTLASAQGLDESLFKISTVVTTSCKPNIFKLLNFLPGLISAPSVLANEQNPYHLFNPWAPYSFDTHLPQPQSPKHFYIIKKSDNSWYAKLRVKSITKENSSTKKVTFTLQYKVLQ